MKPSFTARVNRWWTSRKARHHRLEQLQLISSLPDEIRNDIARGSLIDAFDDGTNNERHKGRERSLELRAG